ncbi:MAG: hypothetical protein HWN68_19895 [Desulfobacterales bacterium]|nr:hypothetical protein [Desulfobacterales bacterium]
MNWYQRDVKEAFLELGGSADGLTESGAKERLARYGPNKLAEEERVSRVKIIIEQFTSPHPRLAMVPFESERGYMATLHTD